MVEAGLLHRLASSDVGIGLEAAGHTVFTEREIRTADAAELLADLGARGETFAVPAGARARHWPDLVLVPPDGRLVAVEVELTPKPAAALRRILRAYRQAGRRVVYLGTGPVVRQLHGRAAPGGWIDGIAQAAGLLPTGGPDPGAGGLLRIRPFTAADPGVARQVERHASRYRRPA